MGDKIGSLFVKIGADLTGLHEALGSGGKADKDLQSFTSRVNNGIGVVGKSLTDIGLTAATALATGIAIAVHEAGDFQTAMTGLVTGAGELDKNLPLVSKGILDMAGKVGESADDLAKGMFMIESAGFHGAEGLKVLQAAAEGAKVGGADLQTTADAVTTVLRDYHMSANQAADATNFLVAVVAQGKTHMEDLAGSLAMILPTASSLHVPLDQIGGAMATMTSKGVPAAVAATYLKFTLSALAAGTPAASKALESIGLTQKKVADELTTKGLLPALEMIQTQLTKKFPKGGADAFEVLKTILGGTKGLGAGLQLTGENLNDFINATANVTAQVKGAHGQVLGWSKVQGDLNFQIDAAKDAFDAAAIKIGTKLLPPLTDLLKNVIVPMIPKLADMASKWTDKLLPPVVAFAGQLSTMKPDFQTAFNILSTLAPYIVEVGAAWVVWNIALAVTKGLEMATMAIQLVAGIIQIVRTVGLATAAQFLWDAAMDANPIGLVIIAIAALAAGVIYAYTHFGWFRSFVNGAWDVLKGFGHWVQYTLWPIIKNLSNVIDGIGSGINNVAISLHNGHIPGFATGGIVPGPMGAPQLAIVHGGERVQTPQQQREQGSSTGGGQAVGTRYVVNTQDLLSALWTLMQEAEYSRMRGAQGFLG